MCSKTSSLLAPVASSESMLNVGDPTESPSNIMQSVSVGDARGFSSADANFRCVIIEHEGKNVAHVPAKVIEPEEMIEDVSRAT